jgi:hypothetical protein
MSTSERSAKATPQGQPRMSEDVRLHTRVVMAPGAGGFQRSFLQVDETEEKQIISRQVCRVKAPVSIP